MELGISIRNYGSAASTELLTICARRAEAAGIDHIWIADHIAIPPEESQGSGGRYIDPLATAPFLAAKTERIGIGISALVLPHRRPLPMARWIASIQELSAGRFLLGVGVGAMAAEYRANGVPFERRGAIANETLAFIRRCFASDHVEANGQTFIFAPRPACPPIYIGGAGPHAIRRIARYGDGWIAPRSNPNELREQIPALQEAMEKAGRVRARVLPLTALNLEDPPEALERVAALSELGVDGLVYLGHFETEREFATQLEKLATHIVPVLTD